MAIPPDTQRQADIRAIVGGNFTGDALGRTYDQILARLTAAPGAYLDTFEHMFLRGPPRLAELSRLFLPSFLKRLAPHAPDRVRDISRRLLGQVETSARVVDQMVEQAGEADQVPEQTAVLAEDLGARRRELAALAGAAA